MNQKEGNYNSLNHLNRKGVCENVEEILRSLLLLLGVVAFRIKSAPAPLALGDRGCCNGNKEGGAGWLVIAR